MPGPPLPQVRYAPGPGVLLGAGSRWLLIDVPDPDDPGLEGLWELLTAPATDPDRVVATVEERYGPAVSLVLLDLSPGSGGTVERGSGRLHRDGERRVLTLGDGTAPSSRRRLGSGMVAAGAAEITPARRRPRAVREPEEPAGPPPPGVIDGVPPEILTASAPTPPQVAEPRRPTPDRSTSTTDEPPAPVAPPAATRPPTPPAEPPTHTTYRPDRAARHADDGGPDVDHPLQGTHETVLAVRCTLGHLTPSLTANCRVCHAPVPPQEPERVPRPRLGVLRLPDNTRVPLDRGVVFGRQPEPPAGGDEWPQLVKLPNDNSYVSRNHLRVELDGWLVLATDLGSKGGTTLRIAGREPERIRAGERYIWEPGQVLDLADGYEILYEVPPDDTEPGA